MYNNSLEKGTILRGCSYSYEIVKTLDQGSFGITYLAKVRMEGSLGSIQSNMFVAIKEFFMREINGREGTTVTSGSKGGLFEDYRRKFVREAMNLSKLSHPNIIKVVEAFETNNTCYYVMEYIEGGSLDDMIVRRHGLSAEETARYSLQIASALAFMHSNKMLHLDLKPKNIMMNNGNAVLIDFGLSKQYDTNGEPESSTTVGTGTPGYAPIEQANYQDGNGFPVTMDIYALGATMFKMLTGKRPPIASDILNDGFPSQLLKDKNQELAAVVEKAMHPMKRQRIQTVEEMMALITDDLEDTVEKTVVDVEIANRKVTNKQDTVDKGSDDILRPRRNTGKVSIEYYPSCFSGKEEQIREISHNFVRYTHGHNLFSLSLEDEKNSLTYNILNEDYNKFLTELRNLNLKIASNGNDIEEYGTDNTRLRIILYDENGKEYKNVWKYSWYDDYGGGESGKLEGKPEDIYDRILKIIPQAEKLPQKRTNNTRKQIKAKQTSSPMIVRKSNATTINERGNNTHEKTSADVSNQKPKGLKTTSNKKRNIILGIAGSILLVLLGYIFIQQQDTEPQQQNAELQQQNAELQPAPTNTINGHEYVDLGLSVKWATCNVGASSPSDYGDYFAWGETSTKSEYTEENSTTDKKSMSDISGDSLYDAAYANWGGTWRLPTGAEIDELIEKCERKWTTQGGHNGYLITGPNGNSIFLPATGRRLGASLGYVGERGYYLSYTPFEGDSLSAYFLYFDGGSFGRDWYYRGYRCPVRPVSE